MHTRGSTAVIPALRLRSGQARGNPVFFYKRHWVPAFAGTTTFRPSFLFDYAQGGVRLESFY